MSKKKIKKWPGEPSLTTQPGNFTAADSRIACIRPAATPAQSLFVEGMVTEVERVQRFWLAAENGEFDRHLKEGERIIGTGAMQNGRVSGLDCAAADLTSGHRLRLIEMPLYVIRTGQPGSAVVYGALLVACPQPSPK